MTSEVFVLCVDELKKNNRCLLQSQKTEQRNGSRTSTSMPFTEILCAIMDPNSKKTQLREDFVPSLAYIGEKGRRPDTSCASASIAGHTHFDRKLPARILES